VSKSHEKIRSGGRDGDERVIGKGRIAMPAGAMSGTLRRRLRSTAHGPFTEIVLRRKLYMMPGSIEMMYPGRRKPLLEPKASRTGNAFHAPAEAEGKMAHSGNGVGEAAAEKDTGQ